MERSRMAWWTFLTSLAALYTTGVADTRPGLAADFGPSAALRPSYRKLWADELEWELFGWDVGGGASTATTSTIPTADDNRVPIDVRRAAWRELDDVACKPAPADEVAAGESVCEFPADLPPYDAATAAAAATDFGYAVSHPADLPPAESFGNLSVRPAASADLGDLVEDPRHSSGAAEALRINQVQDGLAVVATRPRAATAGKPAQAQSVATHGASYGCGYANDEACDYGSPCAAGCGCDEWEWYGCEYQYRNQPRYGASHCDDDVEADAVGAASTVAAEPEVYLDEVVREDLGPETTGDEDEATATEEAGDLARNEDLRRLLTVAASLVRRLAKALESVSADLDEVAADLPKQEQTLAAPAEVPPADLPPAEPAHAAERPVFEVDYLGL